jgi:hypothetical protein
MRTDDSSDDEHNCYGTVLGYILPSILTKRKTYHSFRTKMDVPNSRFYNTKPHETFDEAYNAWKNDKNICQIQFADSNDKLYFWTPTKKIRRVSRVSLRVQTDDTNATQSNENNYLWISTNIDHLKKSGIKAHLFCEPWQNNQQLQYKMDMVLETVDSDELVERFSETYEKNHQNAVDALVGFDRADCDFDADSGSDCADADARSSVSLDGESPTTNNISASMGFNIADTKISFSSADEMLMEC